MAESPAHKFGQVIGELLESVIKPSLEDFCREQGLYLDHKANKRQARRGRKVSWSDHYGNSHDLDYVIERAGSVREIGQPVAFIEVAWRRYTKHSRNKVQEIQGAILPLAEKFRWNNPFLGAVLAGEFTSGSLEQLRSHGFHILYFPYEMLVSVFKSEGIDILFDERTLDEEFRNCAEKIMGMSQKVKETIKSRLIESNASEITCFLNALERYLERSIKSILVIPLFGRKNEFVSFEEALNFLDNYLVSEGSEEFRKYEIIIEYSNGDKIDASFSSKEKSKEFLKFVSTNNKNCVR
jgi:hypothetical protein